MAYPIPSHRIHEIVQAPKCLGDGETLALTSTGANGSGFDVTLDVIDGPHTDLRYLGKAHDLTKVDGYEANLLLAAYRVRGVGHNAVGRRHWYKNRIPAGWHQNILDPNLPTGHPDFNRHEPLPDFAPTDFKDFINKTAGIWSIDLAWEETML